MKEVQKYSFKKGDFQQTKDAINAILWAMKLHGPFTDGPRATTEMYNWILDQGFWFNSKYTFSSSLQRLEKEGILDRGVKGKTTHNVRFVEAVDPPFSNPLTVEEEAPPTPVDNGSKHESHFHNMDLAAKRKHLSHEHDKQDYETIGATGPELEIVHRDCHDIESILEKGQGRSTDETPESEPSSQVPEDLPLPEVDMDPGSVQGKILSAMTLLSSAMLDAAGSQVSSGPAVEALLEEIQRLEAKADKYESKYARMKEERDRLWHINKRQEANLDSLINGKPIDDREYRNIRREMATPPGQDRSSGFIARKRNGGVAHVSVSEGYEK